MGQRPVHYTHVVSFRLDDEMAVDAERLRAAFENQTWAEMGRWLFTNKRIRSEMEKLIQEEQVEVDWELEPA
jgi:hypothetical protein